MAYTAVIYYAASGGDIVTAFPVAKQIQRRHPGCRIYWICKADTAELFDFFEPQVIPVPKYDVGILRRERIDLAIDLTGSGRAQSTLRQLSAREFVTPGRHLDRHRGKGGGDKHRPSLLNSLCWHPHARRCMRRPMPRVSHISWRLQQFVARVVGVEYSRTCPSACVKSQYRWTGSPSSGPIVALYGNSRRQHKTWPQQSAAKFLALVRARRLANARVVLSSQDGRTAWDTDGGATHVTRVKKTWCAQMTWIREVSAVVGPDTGPVHLAAALGAPTVVLYGPTPSVRCGALGPRVVNMDATACGFDPSLRPCWHRIPTLRWRRVHLLSGWSRWLHCKDQKCLKGIKPQAVLGVVSTLLRNHEEV